MKILGESIDRTERTMPGGRLGFFRSAIRGVWLFGSGVLFPWFFLLCAALLMAGCVGEDLEYVAPSEPVIGGISARTDTVGRPVNFTIPLSQTGGTARHFTITPDLPSGLRLDTVRGIISGTPTTSGPEVTYTIIANGFGGSDTATFVLRITPLVPLISYPGPFVDTLGRAVSHMVRTNGATLTAFAINPQLPSGLQFSTTNGRITGTPLVVSTARSYTVTATGPAGTGTAVFVLSVIDGTVVTPPPPPPPPGDSAGITASLTLGYASGIPLAKLVITAISSVSGDAVIRDTLSFGPGGYVGTPGVALSVERFVLLRSLRSYTVQVKTLDVRDSTIHLGSGAVASLSVNQKRAFPLTLAARYAAFTAQIQFYSNANQVFGSGDIPLTNRRAVFVSGSDTLYDTLAAGGSFPTTGNRMIGTPYVPADKVGQFEILIFGTSPGWDASKPFIRYFFIGPYVPGTTVYLPPGSYEGPAPE